MKTTPLSAQTLERLKEAQRNEISEYHLYRRLARNTKNADNAAVLERIAEDEKRHHDFWAGFTDYQAKPRRAANWFHFLVARLLGLTFGVRLMELGEERAQLNYQDISKEIPEAAKIAEEEDDHEKELIGMINEEGLEYVGSIVLGLNDALVELTGALAGLTFALQSRVLVAVAGLITGIAASFSMAASEYLSHKSEGKNARALKSAIYTGIAYVITVLLLILPFLLFPSLILDLGLTLLVAVLIIFFFNYYISVAKATPFWSRFWEMTLLSMGVAAITFLISVVIRSTLGIEV